ncbi:hypothetical protein SLS60_008799 [Paraconiothyrium brasiliense]|uniref:Uncharacterized protein n=1 Tax=Paraconiothyrium brasiliense TaxID=300254 RepID=A0ABR3QYJ3_9PLEO
MYPLWSIEDEMASYTAQDKEIEAIQPSPPVHSETSSQFDDAYETYKKNQDATIDAAEARRVLRKIDFRIVPILFFIYLLQYLDKNGINYASAYGLTEGTNLQGQDFSWLGTYGDWLCRSAH